MTKMTIAVAGCINRDTVIHPGRAAIRGFGGILYNVFGLTRLLGDAAMIIPICNLGRNVATPVPKLLSPERNIGREHIRVVDSPNNHCTMTYPASGERFERFTGFVPAISHRQLKPALSSAIMLVNFISGRDITLTSLRRFRSEYGGVIYLDFHTLALGLRRDGTRFLRRPKRWCEYVALCDYLQLNSNEFSLLAGDQPSDKSMRRFYDSVLRRTCTALVVTLGAEGAAIAGRKSAILRVSPSSRPRNSEPTGAGDLVAAGFCAGIATGMSLDKCLKLAVECGRHACSVAHPQDLDLPPLSGLSRRSR